tara:strand:+ start:296 stop:1408 length:1113 start_codon:yes stop_codon:yes gene_type:complete
MARKINAEIANTKLISLLLIALVGIIAYSSFVAKPTTISDDIIVPTVAPAGTQGCPDSLATTLYARVKNDLNTTEFYKTVSLEIYDSSGSYLTNLVTIEGTDGTYANTGSVTWCGKTVKIYPTANGTTASIVKGVSAAGGQAKIIRVNGDDVGVQLDISSGDVRLNIIGEAFSDSNEVRAYDDTNRGYLYNTSQSDGTTWISCVSGRCATFGTTSASTAEAIGAGGQLAMTFEFRTAENYENAASNGYWVMVDAGTSASTYWEDLTAITVNGNSYSESSDKMTVYESKRFSATDWAFLVEDQTLTRSPVTKIGVIMDATSNNPVAQNITFTIAPRGVYKGQDGTIQIGASKDDTSYSAVIAEFQMAKEIS